MTDTRVVEQVLTKRTDSNNNITMKKLIVAIVLTIAGVVANAAPYCCYFNNDGNKVTIIFTDEDAVGEYIISDVMLYPVEGCEGYEVNSAETNVTDGVAKVTLTFQHLTKFSNPVVKLSINGKEAEFKVTKLKGTWQ